MFERELTKRQIQAQNTQEIIYKTALEMMEEKGFQNLKVEEICKTAGVSIGSFYNCFKSKNDILNEVFRQIDEYFKNSVMDKLKSGSSIDRVKIYFEIYADYNVDRGIEFVKQLYGVRNNLFITKGRYLQAILRDIIEDGQEAGEIIRSMTSDEIVEFLFIAIRGVIYHWCLYDGQFDLVNEVSVYINRLVKSISV
ncbi:MAG: transcriptional regulator, TetR family [Clostridia bacterium]|jgi:AcrR family transcriptional regulator|nr:transcriptional regulator, TetR family [Clostridia bacterium]